MKRSIDVTPSRRSKRIASLTAPTSANAGQQRSLDEFRCIVSGTTHQADERRFKGNNSQCVAMSACASLYSCLKNRQVFSTADIDMILNYGDSLYLQLRPPGHQLHRYLMVIELANAREGSRSGIRIGNDLVQITTDWVDSALYPNLQTSDAGLNHLETILEEKAFNADHSDATCSYIFTGLDAATTFWRHDNAYYYFNSHQVDEFNLYDINGRARLFHCPTIKSLAKVLFARTSPGRQFDIERITLVSSEIILPLREPIVVLERLSAPKLKDDSIAAPAPTLDPKLTSLKPVVVLNPLPLAELSAKSIAQFAPDIKLSYLKPTVVLEPLNVAPEVDVKIVDQKPRGRPKKVQRGPQPTKTALDKLEANRESVKKYYEKNQSAKIAAVTRHFHENPEINKDAVNRYSEQNPEVQKAAKKRYEENSRNIEINLRNSNKLIGQRCEDELTPIKTYVLKKTSLFSPEIYKCSYCNAPLFEEEKSRTKWCCGGNGNNKIQNFPPLTEVFYDDPLFISRARAYNNLFAFSALGTTVGFQYPNSGIGFVKVQGKIYHRVFDLSYTESTNPIGMYIDDNLERYNLAAQLNLNREITRSITHFVHTTNPYIETFRLLSQEPSEHAHLIFDTNASRPRDGNILGDRPLGNEISAIISTENERFIPRCIAIWKVGGRKAHTVDIMNPLYETLQYPLLYTHGNLGWHPGKLDAGGESKLTQVKYVRCLLLCEPRFTQLGRLSEEWLVDMQCRILEERLRFIHNMQKPERTADNSDGLRMAPREELVANANVCQQVQNDETIRGEGGAEPGRIYLPSSFTGGDRYMRLKYLDAMALVNRLGQPSFFLTMTCNPKWPEIQQSTPQGQNPSPVVCARVFQLKLAELMRDLRSGAFFGKCVYIIHVIEFQKRGLPHAHIAFRVEGGGPVQGIDIDNFIRADIPSETEAEGRLRQLVLSHMIHGPCGKFHRTDLQCYDKETEKCTRYFPKKETPVTYCDERGFTHLRRDSKNEATIKYRNRDVTVNDLWVVPYNAALLLKYDCHMNLEATSARTIIKYLFKYMTKGADVARVALIPDKDKANDKDNNKNNDKDNDKDKDKVNEINVYVSKRYIGSCDAAWRVCEFDITGREPTVLLLDVHLENKQNVFFQAGKSSEAAEKNTTALLTYFDRPPGEEFDNLTYMEFYERYNTYASRPPIKTAPIIQLQKTGKFITRRQRGQLVTRLYWVSPNQGELFYLRVLLSAYPCRNYEDLIRLGGEQCSTFQDAAKAVGMADDLSEYHSAMQEASSFMTAARLRHFLVMLAVNGVPVASLWDNFKDQLSEDFINRCPTDVARAHENSLVVIDRLMRRHGSSLGAQGLPVVVDNTTELGRERVEYNQEELCRYVEEWLPKLSADQRDVYDYVHQYITTKEFREQNINAIFIDGPAGTGKTLLLNLIASHVRGDLKGVVLCTASSGIAAQNYPNGMTAHSMFKFPIELVDDLGHWSVTNRSHRGELIYNADVIIYDEAPMVHKYLIHMLDRSLKDLMNSQQIFGGKLIIFAGDFRQIPPVVTNARTYSDLVNYSVKSSPVWQQLKIFNLITSQRQTDPEFSQFLLKLGSNQLPSERVKVGRSVQNLIDLSDISYVTTVSDLIDFVFPFAVMDEPDICAGRAILCTHNAGVKEINDEMLARLPAEPMHFFSVDKTKKDLGDPLFLGTDALNKIQPKGIPEHDLVLKVGCVCMIIRNLSFADGLVNGTKVIVVAATPRLITVRKPNQFEDYLIPRICFEAKIAPRSPIEMIRRQFPLQVCYAMSIHKSQGQTINRIGVDLRSDPFVHGQTYVALSRATNKDDIKILTHTARIVDGRCMANNIVIPQLL